MVLSCDPEPSRVARRADTATAQLVDSSRNGSAIQTAGSVTDACRST